MSDTNKQSPLGVNSLNSYLNVKGLTINPAFAGYAGTSHDFDNYSFGSVCQNTVLRVLTHAIHEGYKGHTDISGSDGWPTAQVYNNLITIGSGYAKINITSIDSGVDPGTDHIWFKVTYSNSAIKLTPNSYVNISGVTPNGYNGNWLVETAGSNNDGSSYFRVAVTVNYGAATVPGAFTVDTQVPALGNAKSFQYTWEKMIGPYGTGTFNLGDVKGWGGSLYKNNRPLPVDASAETANPATQWGYIRLLALQAWMEFNYNSTLEQGDDVNPAGYRDFLQSFNSASGFIDYSNSAILPVDNSKLFLDGTYSNMNDLISADVTGVNLATKQFGQDLIALGKALNLSTISTFGLPSNLLKTLVKNNALTQNVSLAIIAAGINTSDLGSLISNASQPTTEQEQKLYAAFFITVGDSLNEVLIPLNCKTRGLESLADLLNPKKIFPNSYASLTVPVYNTVQQPNNSKTYYPIYVDGGTNTNLTSTGVLQQIGIQTPVGTPTVNTNPIGASITIQEPVIGFGSYLSTIVPSDIATAAGAFSASMLQIKNITNVPVEKFAQVVSNIETIAGLNVNGTTVPTDLPLRTQGLPVIALGSGPQGTYTASDFFGCMSGLPYNGPLKNIEAKLNTVATRKLFNIYHELYLAITYQRARMSISQSTYNVLIQPYIAPSGSDPGQPRIDDWYYTIKFSLANSGGGYGRGTAPAPLITISPNHVGASATTIVDRDDKNIPGGFGRIKLKSFDYGTAYKYTTTSVNQSEAPSTPTPPEEMIYVELPPADELPVTAGGDFSTSGVNIAPGYGVGTAGTISTGPVEWPGMNTIIQGYINQSNSEVNSINTNNRNNCQSLNDSWNATGTQLTIEQRARQTGLKPPLGDTRENYLSLFPTTVYNFVDATAQYATNTEPHMYAQTIENISDFSTTGGQSTVAAMRQQRNQERLTLLGIPLDNNIPSAIPQTQQKSLIANGLLPTSVTNSNIPSGSTTSTTTTTTDNLTNETGVDTPIATPIQVDDNGATVETLPIGTYDPTTDSYIINSDGSTLDTGKAEVPGSFAGSPYTNLIPPELNSWYASNTLYPSTYTVSQAIDEVVRCNCDCWQLA